MNPKKRTKRIITDSSDSEDEKVNKKRRLIKLSKIKNYKSETEEEMSDSETTTESLYTSDIESIYNEPLLTTESDKELQKLNELILSREITISQILSSNISDDKKANLLELQASLKLYTEYSPDYFIARDQLQSTYIKYLQTPIEEKDISFFRKKISELCLSEENKNIILKKISSYEDEQKGDEKNKSEKWLRTVFSLPHDKINIFINDNINKKLEEMHNYLNENLYGMENVKERLILFLNKKLREVDSKGCNIALVGISGIGKTAICKCLSKCLDIPFSQISFGNVTSSDFLLGHDYTYLGSREGEISRCLQRLKVKNGIIFCDEFDKISDKKEITSCLLHITDFTQNHEFRDNYLPEIKMDLSKIWFLYSMNNLPTDSALLDRLEVIHVEGYTIAERVIIIKDYVFPKISKNIKLDINSYELDDEVYKKIVLITSKNNESREGIRNIEKAVNILLEKVYFFICNKDSDYYKTKYDWFNKINSYYKNGKVSINLCLVECILKSLKKENDESLNHMYI